MSEDFEEDFEEAKKVEDEIRQRAKLALFDLYDRCLLYGSSATTIVVENLHGEIQCLKNL
jgi:hypothetical protein